MHTWKSVVPLAFLLTACQGTGSKTEIPTYYEIGAVHHTVTTSSPEAQLWFDRGLGLTYGFNHEEAIVCFEKAAALDPGCAMAWWGKANALGPNYNNPEMTPDACKAAYAAVQKALAASDRCTPVEKDLIQALTARYPSAQAVPRPPLDAAYAEALRGVRKAHPDDADVAALCAEALMQQNPWKLWSADGVAAAGTPEIQELLENSLMRWPNHPALCHLYIHTMEAGPKVRMAVPAAERLEGLTPGLGHLVHMSSHVYIWTGRYQDAVRINQLAVEVDKAFVAHAGKNNFYTLYRLHNYHFIAYGAMWTGQRKVALEAARALVGEVPPQLMTQMLDYLDIFMATPLHVMVRFGMWREILAEPKPAKDLLAARAVWHYARGLAYASLEQVAEAEKEQALFLKARVQVPASRLLFNNSVADILAVADTFLEGEIEYRKGNHDEAFASLRKAVTLDEKMNYDEPWGWMEPARHALGALLTEQGRFQEAYAVYKANLARFPHNGWALHGLAECLDQLGRREEAAEARTRFTKAWAHADIEISGSCFCRIGK
jgi:tetratricopeptide (TPR) repeat protein